MINSINSVSGLTNSSLIEPKKDASQDKAKFSDVLNDALNQVAGDLKTAEDMSNKLATGEVEDLHDVTIAMEKANLGVQLTVQVRNKAVEAYQEVMRMQI